MSIDHPPVAPAWRKSSYSGSNGGDCVEVADNVPGTVPVRDSKDPQGPALAFSADAWTAFVADVKADRFKWDHR
ncbi:protein of unknown function [Actinacidiphila alni]|uniref:DUF397 domain-containing protein n=1 Tax=Actinacidiphila alni TaxID=380248 RepID=A0A1I2J6P8_9ACTN|nr:DUF397 domain-containing protein [Actinacidiphila alni]SFF49523.1 protein of unknown function [Actinacidiphila alni]